MTDSKETGGRTMKFGTKLPSSFSWVLSVLVLLCGCGGGVRPSSPPPIPPPVPPPPVKTQDISGNWQFSTRSTVRPGFAPATIAGSVTQSGSSVNAAVHVDGWSCFDQGTTIALTGTITDGNVSLTSTSVEGQVITLGWSITSKANFPDTLTGTYSINGGCGDGEHGNVTGVSVYSITGNWAGNLTTAGGANIHWWGQLSQGGASPEGSSGLTGTIGFDDACFKSGKITSGTFPSASYIMGMSVVLDIKTDNGTITFLGAADGSGLIVGDYTVSGGPCEPSGGGYLSPWEY